MHSERNCRQHNFLNHNEPCEMLSETLIISYVDFLLKNKLFKGVEGLFEADSGLYEF